MRRPVVLIVVANPFLAGLMSDVLEANGVFTVRAATSHDAVDLMLRVGPALVLVDLELPGREAGLVFAAIGPAVRVLALAAAPSESANASAPGRADGVLQKPIDTTLFARAVLNELRRLAVAADQTA